VNIPYAYMSGTLANTSVIQWYGSGSLNAHPAAGGVGTGSLDGNGLCAASGTQFSDLLSVNHQEVTHRDGALSFRGPYKRYSYASSGGGFLDFTYNGSGAGTLNWQYMPNVFGSAGVRGVDGSDLYMRILPSGYTGSGDDYRGENEGVDCTKLPQIGFGLQTSLAQPASNYGFTPGAGFSTAYNEGRVQFVLCPYTTFSGAKNYFKTALDYRNYSSGGPSIVDNGNGTVTVNSSMTWQKCPVGLSGAGCATGTNSGVFQANVVTECNLLNSTPPGGLGGFTNWRVPTRTEMNNFYTNVYVGNAAMFPNVGANAFAPNSYHYWSYDTAYDNGVSFVDGNNIVMGSGTAISLRCVRN